MNRFDKLVEGYRPQSDKELSNAQREVMQKVALAGLSRGGFFKHAAFYGGTCLRIFHKLMRYSEDMDFSLIEKEESVHIENYFQPIVDEFKAIGMPVEIVKKDKKTFGRVESAFLKEDTETYDIKFQTRKSPKVKIGSAYRFAKRTILHRKTHHSASQNCHFWNAKLPLLERKTHHFGTQNWHF